MADRYCVPMSLPCRIPWLGSWFSQKTFSRSAYATFVGSYTTCTASVCPVYPEQTSSYVGFGVTPPAYPTEVEMTPGTFQNIFSAPQKQPIPKTATCAPAGHGPRSGVPSTACRGTPLRGPWPEIGRAHV